MENIEKISLPPIKRGDGLWRSTSDLLEALNYYFAYNEVVLLPYAKKVKISNLVNGYMFYMVSAGQTHDKKIEFHVTNYETIFVHSFCSNETTSGKWEDMDQAWQDNPITINQLEERLPELVKSMK